MDVPLEGKGPVFGRPLAHIVEAVGQLFGWNPVGLVEDDVRAYVHAPRVVLVAARRAPDRRVVLIHRRRHGHACGERHPAGDVVEHPIADTHGLDAPPVAALQTLDRESLLACLAEVVGRADDHPVLRGATLGTAGLPLAARAAGLGGTYSRRSAALGGSAGLGQGLPRRLG